MRSPKIVIILTLVAGLYSGTRATAAPIVASLVNVSAWSVLDMPTNRLGLLVAKRLFPIAQIPVRANSARPMIGKVIPNKKGIEFVAEDGKTYALVEDDISRALFLDGKLQNRTLRLSCRIAPGGERLVVERVQTVKDGKAFNFDYWCDHCLLSAAEPGPCRCCGGPTVLRELPDR